MDYIIRRGLVIGAFFMTLSFFVWPASADWQTPCGCEHLKSIIKTIKADEYAKKRYADKADQYEKELLPSVRVLDAQSADLINFAQVGLPNELMKQMGYSETTEISRDRKTGKVDQKILEGYRKAAVCKDVYNSMMAHEKYHDETLAKVNKMEYRDKIEHLAARAVAREEVEAYEAGLKVLRAARDRLKAQCDWVCDSGRQSANGKSYRDHAVCERSCPGTLGSNMRVLYRCFNAKEQK
jgi:hypothetical protein